MKIEITIEESWRTYDDFDKSLLATLAIDLEDRNYLGNLYCSLYGLQVSFVA